MRSGVFSSAGLRLCEESVATVMVLPRRSPVTSGTLLRYVIRLCARSPSMEEKVSSTTDSKVRSPGKNFSSVHAIRYKMAEGDDIMRSNIVLMITIMILSRAGLLLSTPLAYPPLCSQDSSGKNYFPFFAAYFCKPLISRSVICLQPLKETTNGISTGNETSPYFQERQIFVKDNGYL